MKTCRTPLGTQKNSFEFRTRFAVFGFAIAALTLMPSPLSGAQYYTNWAAAHFSANPALGDPLADPDGDGEPNVVEFAFGTDPLAPGGIAGAVQPLFGGVSGTNAVFQVEILEREGHQPGVQIDLYLSAQLTNWFRPWWLRTTTNSLPSDPPGSVRELFTTQLPGTNVWFVRPKVKLFEGGAEMAKYYVATTGSDGNFGTNIAAPFATLGKAAGLATNGNLVYMRGGTYATSAKISLSKTGTAGQPIRIRAYPGESPVLDFSSESSGTDGISISGKYYWLYGLVITNAGHNSIVISGSNNIVERCVGLGARNSGLHITGGNGGTATPSSNLFLNCDSIRSYDAPVGGNADGFSAKWSLGPGNVFSGCRSWENSDDGWDLWMGSQPVLITNCWASRAGIDVWGISGGQFNGNGNGFKLGGNGTPAPHRLVGCLSFGNKAWGVDQNNNAAGQNVDQNTVWNNGSGAINLNHLSTGGPLQSSHVVRNNAAIGTVSIGSTATYPSIQMSNTWQVLSDVNTNDFLNTDYTWAMAPRRDDGGLPEIPFLRPVPGGRLVDKGMNIGSPFAGSAPDLGAFETSVW
jgi:hypothetical protein